MKSVIFDVKGKVAHFRRPDTTATQLTYPFITPLAAKGLVGAILGITDFVTNDQVGIQLLSPVHTSAQQLSLLGDGGNSFNRPTTLELLVNPSFRIYYVGSEYVEHLAERLQKKEAIYPTYLGAAFALTFPQFIAYFDQVDWHSQDGIIETGTVVPTQIISELIMEENCHYSRAGGFLKKYLGARTFEKSLSYIYEINGKSVKFRRHHQGTDGVKIANIGGNLVCLV